MINLAFMFQDNNPQVPSGGLMAAMGAGFTIAWLAIVVILVASMWKIFTKAGKPGWAAIVPIYNLIVLLEIAGKPIWWFILLLIPIVNLVIALLLCIAVAAKFGKGVGFALGMFFLGFIFFPMLGFGSAQYNPAG